MYLDPETSAKSGSISRRHVLDHHPGNQHGTSSPSSLQAQLDLMKRDHPCYVDTRDGSATPGCKHYASRCEQKPSCCDLYFPCRLCHDEAVERDPYTPSHVMDRFSVRSLSCTSCGHKQKVELGDETNACEVCHSCFASYACTKCMMFHDQNDRDIYHCDQCKICRLGKADENIHCAVCDTCISSNSLTVHTCVPDWNIHWRDAKMT